MQNSKIRILNKNEIKLPYMKRSKFVELIRMGLGYEHGIFHIVDFNRVEEIKDALSEILNKEIIFSQICIMCGNEFLCIKCKYYRTCLSKDLPFHCICKKCSVKNTYDQYLEKNMRVK